MQPQKPSLADLRIQREERAEPRFRARPAILLVFVLLLAGVAAWRLAWPRSLAVHTVLARESSGGDGDHTVLNASGYVTARRAATVSAKVTGKVVEVLIEEGMKVQEARSWRASMTPTSKPASAGPGAVAIRYSQPRRNPRAHPGSRTGIRAPAQPWKTQNRRPERLRPCRSLGSGAQGAISPAASRCRRR